MKINIQLTCLLISYLIGSYVHAQQLYKWVDEHGMTHYSDELPAGHVEHEAFQFAEYHSDSNPVEDYYSIQNQLERLQERRAETLKQKQRAAEIKAAKNPPPREVIITSSEPQQRYYSPAYFPHGLHKPHKYILGKPYYGHQNKHQRHARLPRTPIERPRTGIASGVKVKPSIAGFSASK